MIRRAILLLALLLVVGSCGASQQSNPNLAAVAEKSAATSSRISISFAGKEYFAGAWDFTKDVGTFASGGADEDASWTQIVTSEATYTRLNPGLFGGSARGKWMKIDFDADRDSGERLFGFAPSDPSHLLPLLKASSNVRKVEDGNERGVAVTRYQTTLDVERALRQLPKGQREAFRALVRQYWPERASDGIPLDLAVDEMGLLRRVDLNISGGEQLTVEFFDYGVSVTPKPPPARDVLSTKELERLIKVGCPSGINDYDRGCATIEVYVGEEIK